MSRIVIIVVCLVLFSFGLAYSIDIEFEADDMLACGVLGTNWQVKLKILMDNDDFDRHTMTLPIIIQGDANPEDFEYKDVGGLGSFGAINLVNGFEPGGYWDLTNEIVEYSCDGVLPDTIVFNFESSSGWPTGLGLQTYIEINLDFNPNAFYNDFFMPMGYLCLDTASTVGAYDYYFEEPNPDIYAPMCWSLYTQPNCCIVQYINLDYDVMEFDYGEEISYVFYTINFYGDLSVFTLDYGPGEILPHPNGTNNFTWRYYPDISDVGESFFIGVWGGDVCAPGNGDAMHQDMKISNTNCGDVNGDNTVNILDVTSLVGYLYKNGPSPYYAYNADLNLSRGLNILDISYLISYLYKSGPAPECELIRDDMAIRPNSWWKYERFDSLTSVYDTIEVRAWGNKAYRYYYPTDTVDLILSFNADTVLTSGIYPDRKYIYPLQANNYWESPGNSFDSVLFSGPMTVPAGSFTNAHVLKRVWEDEYGNSGEMYEFIEPGTGLLRQRIRIMDISMNWTTYENWLLIEYNIP